jgi:hypothetical protein
MLLLEIYLDNELLVPFPESNEYRKDEWHLAGVKKRSAQRPNTQKKIYWPIFKRVYFLQSIQRFFLPYS